MAAVLTTAVPLRSLSAQHIPQTSHLAARGDSSDTKLTSTQSDNPRRPLFKEKGGPLEGVSLVNRDPTPFATGDVVHERKLGQRPPRGGYVDKETLPYTPSAGELPRARSQGVNGRGPPTGENAQLRLLQDLPSGGVSDPLSGHTSETANGPTSGSLSTGHDTNLDAKTKEGSTPKSLDKNMEEFLEMFRE